jgi:ABC-type transport system substrate-binding protein
MRQQPIGTGPFKFGEFKPNERIAVTRNPDYWKSGRPYLDGIEYTIITNRSTAILDFIAGKFDMTFPYQVTIPLLRDVKTQVPQAICELRPNNVRSTLVINRNAPPFDNPGLGRCRHPYYQSLAHGISTGAAGAAGVVHRHRHPIDRPRRVAARGSSSAMPLGTKQRLPNTC